jgi:toxin ParE1/3/4
MNTLRAEVPSPETRELPVIDTPYVIIYGRREDDVEIIAVIHGAQRWPPR